MHVESEMELHQNQLLGDQILEQLRAVALHRWEEQVGSSGSHLGLLLWETHSKRGQLMERWASGTKNWSRCQLPPKPR